MAGLIPHEPLGGHGDALVAKSHRAARPDGILFWRQGCTEVMVKANGLQRRRTMVLSEG